MTKLIDIHTHATDTTTPRVFSLQNRIFPNESIVYNAPCSIGIHPWYLPTHEEEVLSLLEQEANHPNVIAIGECGLDKNSPHPFELQTYYFEAQIAMANRLNKPLVIHCVKSYQECIKLLDDTKNKVPAIFHGFTKHPSLADQLIKKGFFLSLGPHILKGRHDKLLETLPLDQIFFETDDQPLDIGEIYHYFCRIRKVELAALSIQISKNFDQVFRFKID